MSAGRASAATRWRRCSSAMSVMAIMLERGAAGLAHRGAARARSRAGVPRRAVRARDRDLPAPYRRLSADARPARKDARHPPALQGSDDRRRLPAGLRRPDDRRRAGRARAGGARRGPRSQARGAGRRDCWTSRPWPAARPRCRAPKRVQGRRSRPGGLWHSADADRGADHRRREPEHRRLAAPLQRPRQIQRVGVRGHRDHATGWRRRSAGHPDSRTMERRTPRSGSPRAGSRSTDAERADPGSPGRIRVAAFSFLVVASSRRRAAAVAACSRGPVSPVRAPPIPSAKRLPARASPRRAPRAAPA